MPSLVIEVEQTLDTASPADKGELDDAIETIKNPDPYLSEEPFDINFSFSVDKAEVRTEGGRLTASRSIKFVLTFEDPEEAANWLVDEGVSEAEDSDDQGAVFGAIDAERLATTLIGDFEGSSVGDEIVDFASEYSVTYQA
jgi:hypothetical protein